MSKNRKYISDKELYMGINVLTGKETKDDLIKLSVLFDVDEDIEKRIDITPEAYMNKEFIETVSEVFKEQNPRFLIRLQQTKDQTNRGCIFDEKETETLNEHSKYLKEKGMKSSFLDEYIDYSYDVDEVIRANSKIDKWVKQIKSAKVDGQELSPLEKFLYVYNILSDYTYKSENEETDTYVKSRSIVNILNDDKIVCVGFANLLVTVCNKLNIPCINQDWVYASNKDGHAICNVYIKDEKYDIDGIYCSDPTRKNNAFALNRHSDLRELYKALDVERIKQDSEGPFKFDESKSKYDDMRFVITNAKVNNNNEMINFLQQCSNKTKKDNINYLKYAKKEREKSKIEDEADSYSRINGVNDAQFVYDYINCKTDKESKLKLIEENYNEILTNTGINDKEIIYEKLEKALKEAMLEKNDHDLSFNFRKKLKDKNVNGGRRADFEIEKIKSDLIPLNKIEQALTNIYKTSRKTKENAEAFAKEKMKEDIQGRWTDFWCNSYLRRNPNTKSKELFEEIDNYSNSHDINFDNFYKYDKHKEKKIIDELNNEEDQEIQEEESMSL